VTARNFRLASSAGSAVQVRREARQGSPPFTAEHVGIRAYKVTPNEGLKPREHAFFMGTGQSNTMSGARGGSRSGGCTTGRVCDFSIRE
jgi:hypothetical protein